MIPFIEQAQGYAAYHKNELTRYTHMAGIPLIILSFMILLGFVHVIITNVLDVNVATIASLVLLIYYFRLDWRLALTLTPIFIFLLWVAHFFSYQGPTSFGLWSFIIVFLMGSILQAIGHFLEAKRPAFVDNLSQVLIAPLVIMAELFFMAGYMQALKEEIYETKLTNNPVTKAEKDKLP